MSQRSALEDRYTVKCRSCGHEIIDPTKRPAQKYIRGKCPECGRQHPKKEK